MTDDLDRMPVVTLSPSDWTPEERAEFLRRRRARNGVLLAAVGGFALMIYIIAMIKLHEYGQMW